MFPGGRRNYRQQRNIGRGRGWGIGNFEGNDEFDPVQYVIEEEMDEEAHDDIRAATARHQQRVLDRTTNRIAADNAQAQVRLSEVKRIHEQVKLQKTNAVRRQAEVALEKEQHELAVQEEINDIQRRLNRH